MLTEQELVKRLEAEDHDDEWFAHDDEFRDFCFSSLGIDTWPGRGKLYNKAYTEGHADGWGRVYRELRDLVALIREHAHNVTGNKEG